MVYFCEKISQENDRGLVWGSTGIFEPEDVFIYLLAFMSFFIIVHEYKLFFKTEEAKLKERNSLFT